MKSAWNGSPFILACSKPARLAVPMNFRYTVGEIDYRLGLADATVLVLGPSLARSRCASTWAAFAIFSM